MSSLESSGKQTLIGPAKGDDNPFQSSFPLRFGNKTFVGKNFQIKEIVEKIQSQSFLIVGPHRIGKSSFLEHVNGHLCGVSGVEVFKYVCAKVISHRKYFSRLQAQIYRSSKNGFQVVVLIEEVDFLAARFPHLIERLRLMSLEGFCQVVMTGAFMAFETTRSKIHPLFKWFEPSGHGQMIKICQLEIDDVMKLIELLLKKRPLLKSQWTRLNESGFESFVRITGKVPHIVQEALSSILVYSGSNDLSQTTFTQLCYALIRAESLWDYVNNFRIPIFVEHEESHITYENPDGIQKIWKNLVLAVLTLKSEHHFNTFDHGIFFFDTDYVMEITESLLGDYEKYLLILSERFNKQIYERFLDLYSLTIVFGYSQSEKAYFFHENIYPFELRAHLDRQGKNLSEYIAYLIQDLCSST